MRPEHWLLTIPLRLRSLFRRVQADQELDDELRDHLARKTEEYVAQGMTQEQAHRQARLDLDGIEQTKREMPRRSTGFTTVAVLSASALVSFTRFCSARCRIVIQIGWSGLATPTKRFKLDRSELLKAWSHRKSIRSGRVSPAHLRASPHTLPSSTLAAST
jgi:hypothetical protein